MQLYFERQLSYVNVAKVLAAEGYIILKLTVWATIRKYKMHGTLCRLPGSRCRFKLTLISRLPVIVHSHQLFAASYLAINMVLEV